MNFILPLGLLALLSVAVLVLLYILKPTYQNKTIPSTYIWKESLKFRKREKPGNIFRNLLLILCQILALALCAFIIAQPLIQTHAEGDADHNIIVIDASANMLAAADGETRFDRALEQAKEFTEQSVKENKPVSVILAGEKSECIVQKELSTDKINTALDETECSYARGDVAGAMQLADSLMENDPYAQVYFFTATQYENTGDVTLIDVSDDEDWNACVLNVRAEREENYENFFAEVAVYGNSKYLNIILSVDGVNGEQRTVRSEKRLNCTDGQKITVEFSDLEIFSFENAVVTLEVDDGTRDSFSYDDSFVLYGGKKETIKIQYASTLPNNFLSGALLVLQSRYADIWDIQISEPTKSSDIKTSGFDFYIFEHTLPSVMPSDGVVFLVDPTGDTVKGLDVTIGASKKGDYTMTAGVVNPIMNYIDVQKITAVTYRPITLSEGYETLMYCDGDSVFAVKNTQREKIAVLTLDLNRSNLSMLLEFPVLINNLFSYYLPETLSDYVFDVGETITVNARGSDAELKGATTDELLNAPVDISVSTPGSYRITQTLLSGEQSTFDFYVKIAAEESNFNRIENEIDGAVLIEGVKEESTDIYIYLAIAVVVCLAAERFLYSREKI